jgi:hypothetical protein
MRSALINKNSKIMKRLHIYLLLFFSISISYSQWGGYTYFESGTLENWTNSDGSITNLTIEQPGSDDSNYLRKICDGTSTVLGEMAVSNPLYFQDNYYNGGAALISLRIKNNNPFDLHLRLGFTDFNNTKIVQTTPLVIPTLMGEWQWVDFYIGGPQSFTLIEGNNSILDVLLGTFEMRLIHNENISFDGAYENGSFEIDNIGTTYLGIDDFKNESVKIYPVPATDIVYLDTNNIKLIGLEVYDLSGKKQEVINTTLESLNLVNLANGLYLIKIIGENGTILKKIIKN